MRLSDFKSHTGLTLLQDGEFDILAPSNTDSPKKILSFIEDNRFLEEIKNNKNISCIISLPEYVNELKPYVDGIFVSVNPRISYFSIHNNLCLNNNYVLSSFDTSIGDNCQISSLSYIDAKNVKIGNNVVIEEFVSIRGHCNIDDNTVIHSGTQIGGSGYEFKIIGNGFLTVTHAGSVAIGKNSEIWSCVSIHKAVYPWDSTMVGDNVRINSQVHIDHGVKIGNCVKICAGTVVSGRVNIGQDSFIGPGGTVSNRIDIGESSKVLIGSVVTKNVDSGITVSGNFAIDHEKFINNLKKISK